MSLVRFRTEDGVELEGELRLPEGQPAGSAVICHAHPMFGGSKDHPLLWAIRIALARSGFAVLAFNFRGVMGSEGEYGEGKDEVDDVRAAIGRAEAESAGPTFACGWSFGAHVLLREALDDDRVDALGLIGLPLADSTLPLPPLPDVERLGTYRRPVLLVAGEADPYCPVAELLVLAGRLLRSAVEIVPRADHYLTKQERRAAEVVGRFASEQLLGAPGS
jgi:hypothetical protein